MFGVDRLTRRSRRTADNTAVVGKAKRPSGAEALGVNLQTFLKHIPQILVINLVMELNLCRLHNRAEQTRTTVGGSLL
jgi:hypothetical protein